MPIDPMTGKADDAGVATSRVYDIFSNIAPRYERFNAISSLGRYRSWLATLADMVSVESDDDVLDVAGGTGDVAFTIARTKHPAHILLTDLVPEMLDVARDHAAAGAGDGVAIDFQVADAQALPFEDERFDVVTMAYGIRNMPKREQALAEVFRVLKPGGEFVCLEFSTPKNELWKQAYHAYLNHMIPLIGGLVTGRRDDFVYLSKSIKAFPTQEAFASMLKDAGFEEVFWRDCSGGIATVHLALKGAR